jgi:penicillin V acylase-like amidase (Ntn superfamily)
MYNYEENNINAKLAVMSPIIVAVLLLGFPAKSYSCTTFCLKNGNQIVYGRNYDFDITTGFIVINRRGLEKTAFVKPPSIPAKWISKYGSITFNQIGIELPMDGMNEKGLVIAQMALFESKYPPKDDRPCLGGLQWIQYQLDNSATLDEVIENNIKIRIEPDIITVHYLICDSLGNVGIIEFLNGRVVIHKEKNIVFAVLSNDTYDKSMNDLKEYTGFGGQKPIPVKWDSVSDVIAKTCSMIVDYKSTNTNIIDYGFNILNEVGSSGRTQWSVVYDIKNKRIFFKSLQNKEIRIITINDLDYSCRNNIRLLDIQKSTSQESIGKQFFDFSLDYYRNYLRILNKTFKDNMPAFPDVPDELFNYQVNYPLMSICNEK